MNKKLTTGKIKRELALLIKEKQSQCTTDKAKNYAVEVARQEINTKYGKNWRERYAPPQSYDEWWSESNLDGSFAYNNASEDF